MKQPIAIAALSIAVGFFAMKGSSASSNSAYEESLLTDWSVPPPWPVFVVLNGLAGALRGLADALTPPPIKMLDIGFSYFNPVLAYICAKHEIAEFLATGPKTVEEIAAYTQTEDVMTVERIMYAMASIGITKLDPSVPKGGEPRFVNTPLSATLRASHPHDLRGMIGHLVEDAYPAAGKLAQSLGPNPSTGWDLLHAKTPKYHGAKGYWAFCGDHPETEEQFGRAMMGVESLGGGAMALDGPFHKFDRFIDVGGSMGHFLYKNMKNHPSLKAVLFDLPSVVDNAKKLWFEEGGAFHDGTEERIEVVGGSFFEEKDLPEAMDGDVYHMRYILHDWPKAECVKILKNIRAAMGDKKATLMIGECAIPDRDATGLEAMTKIDMQMITFFGSAMERTPSMWKALLDETGFEMVAIHPTRSLLHFVEAVPK